MEIIKNYTIGSDFELFLLDKNTDEIINAKKYVRGSKTKPYNFDKSSPFWCTSLDNISMEGNIAPCTTAEDFSKSIQYVIDYMNKKLPENLCTVHTPAAYVNYKHLNTPESKKFGCEASYNAYTLGVNQIIDADFTNLRTCCTHVHIKYDNMNIITSAELIKAMDLYLGIPSLLIEPVNDRRTLYGTLGEMRFSEDKTTEYRVLSSFFSQSDELRKWVFQNTINSINFINEGNRVTDEMHREFEMAMSENNLEIASNIVTSFNIPMPL